LRRERLNSARPCAICIDSRGLILRTISDISDRSAARGQQCALNSRMTSCRRFEWDSSDATPELEWRYAGIQRFIRLTHCGAGGIYIYIYIYNALKSRARGRPGSIARGPLTDARANVAAARNIAHNLMVSFDQQARHITSHLAGSNALPSDAIMTRVIRIGDRPDTAPRDGS
jgi:hypothetical protein